MADHFLPGLENLKHSFNLPDFDPNTEFLSSFNPELMINSPTHLLDNLFPRLLYQPSGNPDGSIPGLLIHEDNSSSSCMSMVPPHDNNGVDRKRKLAMEISFSPANSCHQNGIGGSSGGGRGKKVKGNINGKKEQRAKEVVHVRAKRGQATDSHSLAERVRREKINERIRCLQDIVPGCYKTMGMAVMLDEIINYVQSLQNQVEFLSMKLTAASAFYDFNSDSDALVTMQRPKAFDALNAQNGANAGFISNQFAVPNFECYAQLPHNR